MSMNIHSVVKIRDDTVLVNLILDDRYIEHHIRQIEDIVFNRIKKHKIFRHTHFDHKGFIHHERKNKYHIFNKDFKHITNNGFIGTITFKEGNVQKKSIEDRYHNKKFVWVVPLYINLHPENHNSEELIGYNFKNPNLRDRIFEDLERHIIHVDAYSILNVA